MILLDTDVMVDVYRGTPAASIWMASDAAEYAALPGPVILELLKGCRTKFEARHVERFTNGFRVRWPTFRDCERARRAFADANLAHGISIVDILVAETAVGLEVPLMTFNEKHFRAVPDLVTQRPYER